MSTPRQDAAKRLEDAIMACCGPRAWCPRCRAEARAATLLRESESEAA